MYCSIKCVAQIYQLRIPFSYTRTICYSPGTVNHTELHYKDTNCFAEGSPSHPHKRLATHAIAMQDGLYDCRRTHGMYDQGGTRKKNCWHATYSYTAAPIF